MKNIHKLAIFLLASLFAACKGPVEVPGNTTDPNATFEEVVYYRGEFELKGYLSKPKGTGPFPAVIYNHGGMGNVIGGAPEETCRSLARDGFVGFSPIRRPTVPLEGHLDDVFAGIEFAKQLSYVDSNHIGIMGFSRGALLTFEAGIRRSDYKALIIMAVAPGRGNFDELLPEANKISAPVLLLVAENDTVQANSVLGIQRLYQELESAGKQVEMIIYPPYKSDGHQMFFEIGDYWSDVKRFLIEHLKQNKANLMPFGQGFSLLRSEISTKLRAPNNKQIAMTKILNSTLPLSYRKNGQVIKEQ
ncbi:MAG: dienelactone hydrolase family protein [bacterium]